MKRVIWTLLFVGLYKLIIVAFGHEWYIIYAIPAMLVLMLGLPHGATDHLLNNIITKNYLSGKINWGFLIAYLSILLIYGVIWVMSASLALLIFLLMSAYHFGETQWMKNVKTQKREHKLLLKVFFFCWGALLLSILFSFFNEETTYFLQGLLPTAQVAYSLVLLSQVVLPMVAIATIVLAFYLFNLKSLWIQGIELLALIFLIWQTDLIFSFTIFFTIYHSRDTINHELEIINNNFNKHLSWNVFYKHALPFTTLSLFGIAAVILLVDYLKPGIPYITLFFVMISLVTAPHMWVIERFYRLK